MENAATQLTFAFLKGITLEDQIATLAALTPGDANEALQTMMLPENEVYVQIDPAAVASGHPARCRIKAGRPAHRRGKRKSL